MPNHRQTVNEDLHFWVLRLLQENPGMTQRAIAKKVGIGVSGVNYCLKALVEKGWLKAGNFSNNPNKLGYAYLLTPTGISEKAALTARFLKRKMAEYDQLREEIAALQNEVSPSPAHQPAPNKG